MTFLRETGIRKLADEPTITMLDLWRSLSEQRTGAPIEIMVCDRREDPQFRSFPGEVNTARPDIIKGKVVLILWLDSPSSPKLILVTHEVGHWVLKLRGFRGFIDQSRKHSYTGGLLNSMVHHPPLYALQKSVGHDPQPEIDSRAFDNIKLFSKGNETGKKQIRRANALSLADDLMNCQNVYRTQLEEIVNKKYPLTARLLKKILRLVPCYNLLEAGQNLEFSKKTVQVLKLGSYWREIDEVKKLISKVAQAQGTKAVDNNKQR